MTTDSRSTAATTRAMNPSVNSFRIAGARWPIEEMLSRAGKEMSDSSNYQVRLYHAWYRHITLVMIAHSFLAVLAHRHRSRRGDPHPRAATAHIPRHVPQRRPQPG